MQDTYHLVTKDTSSYTEHRLETQILTHHPLSTYRGLSLVLRGFKTEQPNVYTDYSTEVSLIQGITQPNTDLCWVVNSVGILISPKEFRDLLDSKPYNIFNEHLENYSVLEITEEGYTLHQYSLKDDKVTKDEERSTTFFFTKDAHKTLRGIIEREPQLQQIIGWDC